MLEFTSNSSKCTGWENQFYFFASALSDRSGVATKIL
jgi:hypothetical protein